MYIVSSADSINRIIPALFAFIPQTSCRFENRLYVPLPDTTGRRQLITSALRALGNNLTADNVEETVEDTEGKRGLVLCAAADRLLWSLGRKIEDTYIIHI